VCLRPGPVTKPVAAVKLVLKCLAQRQQLLTTELATLDRDLDRLVAAAALTLCALRALASGHRASRHP
jgi:hypothetical protein